VGENVEMRYVHRTKVEVLRTKSLEGSPRAQGAHTQGKEISWHRTRLLHVIRPSLSVSHRWFIPRLSTGSTCDNTNIACALFEEGATCCLRYHKRWHASFNAR